MRSVGWYEANSFWKASHTPLDSDKSRSLRRSSNLLQSLNLTDHFDTCNKVNQQEVRIVLKAN